jgi:hypothetical protein
VGAAPRGGAAAAGVETWVLGEVRTGSGAVRLS